jgi:hypothetical protein
MPTQVAFVAAIGRVSVGADSALPKIQSIVGKFGGTVTGGVGSSQDPIMATFADSENAVKAAQQAYFLDDVEAARVLGADAVGNGTPAAPPANAAQDQGPSDNFPKDYGIKESADAITAVVAGAPIKEAVDALLAEKAEKKEKGEKEGGKEGKGDTDKDDADDKKKKVDESAALDDDGELKPHAKKNIEDNVARLRDGLGLSHASAIDAVASGYEKVAKDPLWAKSMTKMAAHARSLPQPA